MKRFAALAAALLTVGVSTAETFTARVVGVIDGDTIQVQSAAPTEDSKADTVYVTKPGKEFHAAGCRHLKSRTAILCKGAVARGLKPCKVCKP